MTPQVALYARVSSERQAQDNTIESQISTIEARIKADGFNILDEFKFIDNGYSGSNLIRPALEQLRDKIFSREVDKVYILSPDRLSRKYAYQMLLFEEFNKHHVEVIFLNFELNTNPESNLLLQMQGMISEYERAKILERNRRGKIHSAKRGSINVLSAAPYGYKYIKKSSDSGAIYEVVLDEAEVVKKMYYWIGVERTSIRQVCLRLQKEQIPSKKGYRIWNSGSVAKILKNTAYIGYAAYGKTKRPERTIHDVQPLRPKKNPGKLSFNLPKYNNLCIYTEKENWINIPVPAIINEDLFYTVQEQLEENRKKSRVQAKGSLHLLQGLLLCKKCLHAYTGIKAASKRNNKISVYYYYCCSGERVSRYWESKICNNTPVNTATLEFAVWEEVKALLKDPSRLMEEYQRRIVENSSNSYDHVEKSMEIQSEKLARGISKIIDSYTQEIILKEEFEPRIKSMRQKLKNLQEQRENIRNQKNYSTELRLIITNLENFSSHVLNQLENIEWSKKRDIIRLLVKRVEIDQDEVTVVFKVNSLKEHQNKDENVSHDCTRSTYTRCY